MITHTAFSRWNGGIVVDPVGSSVADVRTGYDPAVGAAVGCAVGDCDAVAINCECRLTPFEACGEVGLAARNCNGRAPCGVAGAGIKADQVETTTASLIDITGGTPLQIVEEAITRDRISQGNVEQGLLIWIGFVCPEDGPVADVNTGNCLLYTSPSPRDKRQSRMPSSA